MTPAKKQPAKKAAAAKKAPARKRPAKRAPAVDPERRAAAIRANAERKQKLRVADALNRAIRTAWQIAGIEIVLTVGPLALDAFSGTDPIPWRNLGYAVIRTAMGATIAYVARLRIPPKDTPPPVDAPGDPNDEDDGH